MKKARRNPPTQVRLTDLLGLLERLRDYASDDDYTRADGTQGTTNRADAMREAADELERLRGIVPEVLEQLNDELCAENERLQQQIREWEKLKDPACLHANLLRGIPCKLDRDAFIHLAGNEIPNHYLTDDDMPLDGSNPNPPECDPHC